MSGRHTGTNQYRTIGRAAECVYCIAKPRVETPGLKTNCTHEKDLSAAILHRLVI